MFLTCILTGMEDREDENDDLESDDDDEAEGGKGQGKPFSKLDGE